MVVCQDPGIDSTFFLLRLRKSKFEDVEFPSFRDKLATDSVIG